MEQIYPMPRADLDPLAIYDDLRLPEGEGRPFVAVNMVSSVDGKITLDRRHKTESLGSSVDRALMGRIRAHFDAVLRGAETVRANPYFPGVPDELARRREAAGKLGQPLGIVASHSLDLPFSSAYFSATEGKPIVLTAASSDHGKREVTSRHAHIEVVGDERVDFERALEMLHVKYGIRRLLVEGGAALNYWFVRDGLIDTLFCTLAPKISGYRDDLSMIEGPALIQPIPKLQLETLFHHQDELFFRWSIR